MYDIDRKEVRVNNSHFAFDPTENISAFPVCYFKNKNAISDDSWSGKNRTEYSKSSKNLQPSFEKRKC